MSKFGDFFLFCAGANKSIIKRSPTDYNKYTGIGATVFFTGIMAFLAAAYAIFTVFNNWFTAIFFGVIWGLMIFNLDRYLVSSMKARGNFFRDAFTAFPRILLAILIAMVIAKPLELKIFESEIEAELIVMEQEKFKQQEDKVKDRYRGEMAQLSNDVAILKAEIEEKRSQRDNLALMALQEADGTGGSMQRNLGPIYRAKKADADHAQSELEQVLIKNNQHIDQKNEQLAMLTSMERNDIQSLRRSDLNGFAARMDALGRLSKESRVIFMASLFITLLFIAIECAPILVKLISYRSPYDFVLHGHEHKFEMHHKQRTSLLSNAVFNNVKFDTETSSYRTEKAIKAEKILADHLMDKEVEHLKQKPIIWKDLFNRRKLWNLE